jgi:hypothetical protein
MQYHQMVGITPREACENTREMQVGLSPLHGYMAEHVDEVQRSSALVAQRRR